MTTKHTPRQLVNHTYENGRPVCYFTSQAAEDKYARLYKAAPDLLEACESMLEWMEFTIPRMKGHTEVMNWGGPISKARAAPFHPPGLLLPLAGLLIAPEPS